MEGRKKMAILIDRIKVLEEMLGIMFQQGQESAYYDDKIEIGAMTYSDVEYENGKSDGMDIAYNMIADAPEIKAIPVEWIDEYTTRLVIKRRFLVENGYQDIQNDRYSDYISGIMGMLDDWEKENEESSNRD